MSATTTQVGASQAVSSSAKAATPQQEETTAAAAAQAVVDPTERQEKAQSIVHRNVLWALGVGSVPVPVVDFVGGSVVQLKMLRELTNLYGVKFSDQVAKKILATLIAGLGGAGIGTVLSASLFKFVPIIGTSLGAISLPVVSGAFTLATGRVFVAHFESGGTILDFNPKAIREHFRTEFERAKQTVTQIQKQEASKPA